MSGLEEKQASAATPARQNLYGAKDAKDTQTPAANASNGGTNPGGVPEMLLSLIKRLPVDQRTALSAKLRAVEQDASVGPARKAEIARDFIAKAAKSLEAQRSMLEEQTHTEVDEVEAEAAQVKEPTEAPAAPEGVHEVLLSLTKLPAGQRRVLSGKLREILKDTSIDRDERARVVSILIRRWSHEDQSEVQVTDIEEELLGCEGSSVSEVGVINEVDIDDGTQNMEVLAPLEEQQEQELAEDRNRDLLAMEVVSAPDVELIREEQWPPGETKSGGEVKVNAVGEHELLLNDDVTMGSELSKEPHVVMDDLELEEPVILGEIEIGVDVGEPDVVNEHLNVSDTERSKENPVVGGLSEISGITITDIIAGDDVKAKDIGKSGDFQAGDAIRDDSVVSIMSMGYEGCCIQEESMGTRRRGHGIVDYDYDYGGDVSSAKFKYGRPAFATGGIGMFVVTGRPPGRLIGG